MIIYQVEVTVPQDLVEQWLDYMTSHHIDDVVNTGLFVSSELVRVVDPSWDEHVVFRVRYSCESHDKLSRYRSEFAPALMADHTRIFGDRVSAVRTVTEKVWSTHR
ncbi:MAG TPA: hypothetical protein DCZ59_07490 [Bacteroidetes bacterium]|nr:hypothetical protein [Bacteroidota bacterium]